jgi:hypothetical protein
MSSKHYIDANRHACQTGHRAGGSSEPKSVWVVTGALDSGPAVCLRVSHRSSRPLIKRLGAWSDKSGLRQVQIPLAAAVGNGLNSRL